jgi:glucokinase
VSISNRKGTVLAVDIGGTKIAAARVTGAGDIASRRRETTTTAGPQAIIDQLCQLLGGLRDETDEAVLAVGVGIPAVLEPGSDRVIWGPNLPGFRDIPLRESLESILQLPVYLEYDGHTAVLGEWWRGTGRGLQNVVFVIIGTGIGGGMVLDGRLYRGTNRLAGAVGWFTLATQADEDEPDRRRWESLAAGPGIARRTIEGLDAGRPSRLSRQGLTAEQVFDAARAGDVFAQEIVSQTARIIGIGVANIVSLVNPELVILGGGVGTQADLILEPVRSLVRTQAQPISGRSVRVEVSQLGEDAGLLGAAYTALERVGIRSAR